MARIMLFGGTCMQRNHCNALIFGSLSSIKKCRDVVIDANAEFARNGNTKRLSSFHRCSHDCTGQIALYGNSSPTAFASHFCCRATKVHINVICNILFTQCAYSLANKVRVASVNLQTTEIFVGAKRNHLLSSLIAMNKRNSHHHFTDINKIRPKGTTLRTKRNVGYTRHWCKHHWNWELSATKDKG